MDVQIIHPTLEEYSIRVELMATKYGQETWFDLIHNPSIMTDEDDRDEFDFIYSALGDQLISREIKLSSEIYDPDNIMIDETYSEPGAFPGSAILVGDCFGCLTVRKPN